MSLTPKEYELLYFLAKTPDKVYDREKLLKEVWQYEFFGDLRTVDTHVKRLREKLNKVSPEAAKKIVTVWGVGKLILFWRQAHFCSISCYAVSVMVYGQM